MSKAHLDAPTLISATTTTGKNGSALAVGWYVIRNISISADGAYVKRGGSGVTATSSDNYLHPGEWVECYVDEGYVAAICPTSTATIQILRVDP